VKRRGFVGSRTVAFGMVLLVAVAAACRGEMDGDPRARVPIPAEGAVLDPVGAEYPHLRFADGSRTANDRCMVLQRKLNPDIPPVYVNGKPVGFC
jgi:hypothetical protein